MATGDVNFIETIALGKINKWESKKMSTIIPISFPGQDAGKTEGVDTLGVIAYWSFTGKLTGDFDTIQTAIYDIRDILDGAQISSSVLYSPFVNTIDGDDVRRQGSQGTITSTENLKLKDTGASFYIRGIQVGDKVKNLSTQEITTVAAVNVSGIELTLDADIFSATGEPYAVSANINIKILKFDYNWSLPGLSWIDYEIHVMQVR